MIFMKIIEAFIKTENNGNKLGDLKKHIFNPSAPPVVVFNSRS